VLPTSVFPISGPITGEGQFKADGKGNLSGSQTFDVNGLICLSNFTGTYTVAADGVCTVTAVSSAVTSGCPSGTVSLLGVLYDSGKTVQFIQLDETKVLSGEARKQ